MCRLPYDLLLVCSLCGARVKFLVPLETILKIIFHFFQNRWLHNIYHNCFLQCELLYYSGRSDSIIFLGFVTFLMLKSFHNKKLIKFIHHFMWNECLFCNCIVYLYFTFHQMCHFVFIYFISFFFFFNMWTIKIVHVYCSSVIQVSFFSFYFSVTLFLFYQLRYYL